MKPRSAPLGVIIVGAGYFGTKRIQACLALKNDMRVIGVVDPAKGQREHILKHFQIPTYADLADVPRSPNALAVIAAPNLYHGPLAKQALAAGLHVLCEKPLARTYAEADSIVRAEKRYGRFVKTGSNHRFISYVEKLLDLVKRGAIGHILTINGAIGNNGMQAQGKWFWDPTVAGGGTLLDNGCHLVDIVRYLLGDIAICTGHTATAYWKGAGVEDTGAAIFVTKKGQQAVISSSWVRWDGYLSLEVFGDKGFVTTDSASQIVTWGDTKGVIRERYDFTGDMSSSYEKELLYMKACIETGARPSPSAQDGAQVIRLIEAAYASSRKKQWITL